MFKAFESLTVFSYKNW